MVENIITRYVSRIEKGLMELPFQSKPASLYDPCRYILRNGGKRIRPLLTLIACGLCRGEISRAVPAAIAVELVHTFTLVHDDIMDQAEFRRGKATIHTRWDEPVAILAGDELFVLACRQLSVYMSDPDFTLDRFKALYDTFFNTIHTVCEGQALDMEFGKRNHGIDTGDYLEMIHGKTVALLSGSLVMGGIVAGAEDDEITGLRAIGESVGLAFQIQDDYLDVVADPDKFGKQRGGDIREGKKTWLMLLAMERGNETDRKELQSVMTSGNVSDRDVDRIIRLFKKYDVIENTSDTIEAYYQTAFDLLNRFDESNFKEDLTELITFLKNRDY